MATQQANVQKKDGVPGSTIPENSEDEWDEAQLEAGLKMLKEMHIQLRHLRSTIPRLVTPLATNHKTPDSLLTDYQAAIQTMNKEVVGFREVMTGEEGKRVLQYADERRGKVEGMVKPWIVTEHPGWSIRES